MTQLDSLRAFAVCAVMFFHFYLGGRTGRVPLGSWGVQLFFVLSGFLITGILLKCRTSDGRHGQRQYRLRQFYIRRGLRILPLFYLVLLGTSTFNFFQVRDILPWHLTYASNVYFSLTGAWHGPSSHFWSLAVEEQFYFLWPWLMLFLSEQNLLPAIVAAIIVSPLYKIGGALLHLNSIAIGTMTLGCLDSLGIGALLALYRHKNPRQFNEMARSHTHRAVGVVLLLFLVVGIQFSSPSRFVMRAVNDIIASTFFAWVIHGAAVGFEGRPGRVLRSKPLVYLGKISYGLYVYHQFMPVVVLLVFRRLHIGVPYHPSAQLVLFGALTILVAAVSWHLFEQPINRFRDRFDYAGSDRPVPAGALPSAKPTPPLRSLA